jgi:hypothetical protein
MTENFDNIDPQQWWKNRWSDNLIQILKKYFHIPSTSVPSEMLCSKAVLRLFQRKEML